eukprot:m.186410 g.186410  ORF g.186410 m.186410 type:complete len:121 (+) comp32268_c1_seq1:263-625(+)
MSLMSTYSKYCGQSTLLHPDNASPYTTPTTTSHITHHTPHIINQSARRYPSTHRTYTHTPTHTHAPTATKHTSTHANNHSRDGVIAISSGTHVVLSLLMTGFEGQKGHPQACCLEQTIML